MYWHAPLDGVFMDDSVTMKYRQLGVVWRQVGLLLLLAGSIFVIQHTAVDSVAPVSPINVDSGSVSIDGRSISNSTGGVGLGGLVALVELDAAMTRYALAAPASAPLYLALAAAAWGLGSTVWIMYLLVSRSTILTPWDRQYLAELGFSELPDRVDLASLPLLRVLFLGAIVSVLAFAALLLSEVRYYLPTNLNHPKIILISVHCAAYLSLPLPLRLLGLPLGILPLHRRGRSLRACPLHR
jgi:hypothetical protein